MNFKSKGLPNPLYIDKGMDLLGKTKLLQRLRDEASDLRQWMHEHASPDDDMREFADVANQYAILCTRIYIIEKQW